jgi:nucleotide-binding universal stress UspA family protein
MLFINNVIHAESLAKKAMLIARQCKANLLLCHVVKNPINTALVVHHDDDEFDFDENDCFDIQDLARQLTAAEQPQNVFTPVVTCLEISTFSPRIIDEAVINHSIWLMIMDEQQLNKPENTPLDDQALKVISNINCPLLLMPRDFDLGYFNKIAYATDLRYCDLGVIKFLKVFNAPIFVTHITAPGLPGLDERYAQEILSEEISTKANYGKMFLRNITSENVKSALEAVLDTIEVKMLALVNKKHKTFERLFGNLPERTLSYHNLPTLIFPYLNWFNQASFYA